MKRFVPILLVPLAVLLLVGPLYGWVWYRYSASTGVSISPGAHWSGAVTASGYIPGVGGWPLSEYAVDRIDGAVYWDENTADSFWLVMQSSNDGGKTWTQMDLSTDTALAVAADRPKKSAWTADGGKNLRFITGDSTCVYPSDSSWFPWSHLRLFWIAVDADTGATTCGTLYYNIFGIDD